MAYRIPVKCVQVKATLDLLEAESGHSQKSVKVGSVNKLLVEWNMRPRMEEAMAEADSNRMNHRSVISTVFMPIWWEIVHATPQGETVLSSGILQSSSGLPSPDQWSLCRAVIPAVTMQGRLDVILHVAHDSRPSSEDVSSSLSWRKNNSSSFPTAPAAALPHITVDSYGLRISTFDDVTSDYSVFGEDFPEWSSALNQLISTRTASLTSLPLGNTVFGRDAEMADSSIAVAPSKTKLSFLPSGHIALRLLQWPGPSAVAAALMFETKLSARMSVSQDGVTGDWSTQGNALMGYEWQIHVCRSHGPLEQVAACTLMPSGKPVASENLEALVSTEEDSNANPQLNAWLWRKWRVTIAILRPCDRIIISGKPVVASAHSSSVGGAPPGTYIQCKNCRVLLPNESLESRQELSGLKPSLLLATHNDPFLSPFL